MQNKKLIGFQSKDKKKWREIKRVVCIGKFGSAIQNQINLHRKIRKNCPRVEQQEKNACAYTQWNPIKKLLLEKK